MSIQMNAEQLEAFKRTLNPDPETHKINYPAAYRYIADNFGNQMPAAHSVDHTHRRSGRSVIRHSSS